MRLHARSIGEAVPRDAFDAVIQSVFDSAINLRLAAEDRLITLLISDHYELPQGIRVIANDFSFQSPTASTSLRESLGLRAVSKGGILRFDSSPLTVDLRGASTWKCRVPELQGNMASHAAQEGWSTAWDLLNREQRVNNTEIVADELFQSEVGSPLNRRISSSIMQLIAAIELFDIEDAIPAAEKMIGLGPGVTPAGDDLLIGLLAGLWSVAGRNQARLTFIHAFGDGLMRLSNQTGEISRTYIYHATRGQFSSSLSNLAEAIVTGGDVNHTLQEAAHVGHSSGTDSVTGLLMGLSVWNNPVSAA